MFHFLRNLITFGVLVAALAVTVGATVEVVQRGLPDEAARRRLTLRDMLLEGHLSEADAKVKQIALRRAERELDRGSDQLVRIASEGIEHGEALRENGLVLLGLYLVEKSAAFEQQPDEEKRDEFLDWMLARTEKWSNNVRNRLPGLVPQLPPEAAGAPLEINAENLIRFLPLLLVRFESELAIEDPDERIRVRKLVMALAARYADREAQEKAP